jgi:hypothetical protein
METVSRKVKITERLPEKEGWYACEGKQGIRGLNFNSEQNWDLEELQELQIEYWYEEVSVYKLEDYKVAVGNLQMIIEMDSFKSQELLSNLIIENQSLKLAIERNYGGNCIIAPIEEVQKVAKERYEKALKSIPEKYDSKYTFSFTCDEWDAIKKALRIAAGLEEI